MFGFALGISSLILGVTLIISLMIHYHFWSYRVPGDRSLQLLAGFWIGIVLLLAAFLLGFLAVPWADLPDIVQSYR